MTAFLVAKFDAKGFDETGLNLIQDYLSNRCQRIKLASCFSSFLGIYMGVSQGFHSRKHESVILYITYSEANQQLINYIRIVLNWFRVNNMAATLMKFHMFLASSLDNVTIKLMIEINV